MTTTRYKTTLGISISFVIVFGLSYFFENSMIDSFALFPHLPNYWGLITYQFIHLSWQHLISNLIYFIYYSTMLERKLESTLVLTLFIISGIFGGLSHFTFRPENIWESFLDQGLPLIGASGSIWGLIGVFSIIWSKLVVFGIKFKYLIWALLISEILVCIFVKSSEVSHLSHVGGFFGGILTYFMIKCFTKSK